ncbi:MAG TPA: hypothetical protein VHC69_06830 [Polyangiaceae bacterium]|nr:hypothetical protein [Polyangiaceae bacterium]
MKDYSFGGWLFDTSKYLVPFVLGVVALFCKEWVEKRLRIAAARRALWNVLRHHPTSAERCQQTVALAQAVLKTSFVGIETYIHEIDVTSKFEDELIALDTSNAVAYCKLKAAGAGISRCIERLQSLEAEYDATDAAKLKLLRAYEVMVKALYEIARTKLTVLRVLSSSVEDPAEREQVLTAAQADEKATEPFSKQLSSVALSSELVQRTVQAAITDAASKRRKQDAPSEE